MLLSIRSEECHELCVSSQAHAGLSYGHALKRSPNMIANWLLAANHSRALRPPFPKLRIAGSKAKNGITSCHAIHQAGAMQACYPALFLERIKLIGDQIGGGGT